MKLEEFFEDMKLLREIDLEFDKVNRSENEIQNHELRQLINVRELEKKYSNLDYPEKHYLHALINSYMNFNKTIYPTRNELETLDTPLEELDFSVREMNQFGDIKIKYVGELVKKTKTDLRKRGFTPKSICKFEEILENLKYRLGMKINYARPEDR